MTDDITAKRKPGRPPVNGASNGNSNADTNKLLKEILITLNAVGTIIADHHNVNFNDVKTAIREKLSKE